MLRTADVVVIGGGVMGSASHLRSLFGWRGGWYRAKSRLWGGWVERKVRLDYPAALFASAAGEDGGPGMGRYVRSGRTGSRF